MIGGHVRNLAVNIGFNNSRANSALKSTEEHVNKVKFSAVEMGRQFERASMKMQNVGTWMLTRVTLPLMGLGIASVKAAADFTEMSSMFNVVFDDMARDAEQWASSTAESIGRARSDIMGYMASTQATLIGFDATTKQAAEMSKEIVGLSLDLASFYNLADADALRSMESALIGNHQAALGLRAVLNETSLALAMERMQITGKFQDLSELEKMQVRYEAILMQSNAAVGDAERTSEGLTAKLKELQGGFKTLREEIGGHLEPKAIMVVQWGIDAMNAFTGLDDSVKGAAVHIGALAASTAPLLLGLSMASKMIFYMTQSYGLLKAAAIGVIVAKGTLLAAIGPVAIAVAGMGTILVGLYRNWDRVTESIYKAKDALLNWNRTDSRGFSMGGSNFGMGDLRAPVAGSVSNDQRIVNNRSNSSTYAPSVNISVAPGPRIDNLPQQIRNEVSKELENHYRKSYSALATNTAR